MRFTGSQQSNIILPDWVQFKVTSKLGIEQALLMKNRVENMSSPCCNTDTV